jgi:Flp pilus assembly pilin Flp
MLTDATEGVAVAPSADSHERGAPMRRLLEGWLRAESGQDLIEYAMLAGFISLVAILAITSIGTQVDSWYQGYDATIKTIPSGSGS